MKKYLLVFAILVAVILVFQSVRSGNKTDKVKSSLSPSSTTYQIISAKDLYTLQTAVNSQMSYGWQPVGGITFSGATVFQPMVK